jgi:hypothetical protein
MTTQLRTEREPWMYERVEKIIKDKVCTRCGGELSPIETVDNGGNADVWAGCKRCEVFNYGTSKENYELRKRIFFETDYLPYTHLEEDMREKRDDPEWSRYYFESQLDGMDKMVNFIKRLLSESLNAKKEDEK